MQDLQGRRLKLVRILLGVSLLLGLVFFVAGLVIWTNPLGVMRWLARGQLAAAGLERSAFEAPAGELVYFEGGPTRRETPAATLVLIHGLGDQSASWSGVAPELMEDYRLLIPDLPGHGRSAPDEGPLSIYDHLAAVRALIDLEARGEPVVLVGSSMGGWVSLLYVRERPERVARLVLVASAGLESDFQGVSLLPATRDEARALISAVMGPEIGEQTPGFFVTDLLDKAKTGAASRMRDQFAPEQLLDGELGEIGARVDLIWGDQDGLFDLAYARRLERQLPDAELHVLEGCAHVPHVTCSERFVRVVEGILEGEP